MSTTETEISPEEEQRDELLADIRLSGSVYERLLAILAELPAIGKTQRNQQQNFMYRGHDDVLNALNPLLARYGVFCVPQVLDRVVGERTTSKGSVMYEVNLHVQYTFYGAGGDSFEASAWGEGTDMGDKSTNKAMTMAFKNVLAQVFAVSTAETQDPDGSSPEETHGRARGNGAQTASAAPRAFDPGVDLLAGAIRGEGFQARLAEAMQNIDPTVDWGATLAPCIRMVFGVEARADIQAERMPEFWRRLANAVEKITQTAGDGDFPPVEDSVIVEALAWAFQGAATVVVVPGGTNGVEDPEAEKSDGA